MLNNRIVLKGNLTKDPEYKTISEKELVTFRIAVNESIGNGKEETVYLDVDGWGSHAAYYSVLPSTFSKVVKPVGMQKASVASSSSSEEKSPF